MSEQGLFAMVRPGESEMCIGRFGRFPAAWRSFEEPFFDQERLVNLFDSPGIFADCRSDGVQSDGAAAEFSIIVKSILLSIWSSPRESIFRAVRAIRVMSRSI